MQVQLDVQIASTAPNLPTNTQLRKWVEAALARPCTVSVRIVDNEEMQALNLTYRQKDKPTNVLSFPMDDMPDCTPAPLLGDIVICAPVVAQEAEAGHISLEAHWAHLMVHGSLHLLGYDHEEATEAVIMEAKEVCIMADLGFPSPYTSL